MSAENSPRNTAPSSPLGRLLTLVAPTGAILWSRDFAASGFTGIGPPALSPDGRTLYMRGTNGGQTGLWSVPLAGGRARLRVLLDDPRYVVQTYPGTINVTQDALYLTVGEFESDIWVLTLDHD